MKQLIAWKARWFYWTVIFLSLQVFSPAQAVLSFSGPTTVSVGVPTDFQLIISSTNPDVNSAQINLIDWGLNITNGGNVDFTAIATPASNDVFQGLAVSNNYVNNFGGAENWREVLSGTRPTNVASQTYATATFIFNALGGYTLSYATGNLVESLGGSPLPLEFSSTLSITAVPEQSTTSLMIGIISIALVVVGRRVGQRI